MIVFDSIFLFLFFLFFSLNILYFYQEHRVKVTSLARAFVIDMRDILHVDTTITFHVLSEHLADYRLHFSSFRELSTFRHEHFLRLYTQSKVRLFLLFFILFPVRGSVHSFAPVANSTKFATVFGAWLGNSSMTMSPSDVCSVAVVVITWRPGESNP